MTDYGDPTISNVIISTAYTGSAGAETPSGDRLYLLCPEINAPFQSLMKIKEQVGGNSFANVDGKRRIEIDLTDVFITSWDANHNTDAFSTVLALFYDWVKSGAKSIYLFIYNFIDDQYIKLGINAGYTQLERYIQGFPIIFNWKLEEGNIYYFNRIRFKEAKSP